MARRPHRVFVFVHALNAFQVARDLRVMHTSGADGAFLGSLDGDAHDLQRAYLDARREYPNEWLGLHASRGSPLTAIEHCRADGVWTPDIGIDAAGLFTSEGRALVARIRNYQHAFWRGTFFATVCDQHEKLHDGLSRSIAQAVDIAVVADPQGALPALPFVRALSRTLGERVPLAVAGAFTSENVGAYLPYCEIIILSHGAHSGYLVPTDVGALIRRIRR